MTPEYYENQIKELREHRKHLSEEVLKFKRMVISLKQDCARKDRIIIKLKKKVEGLK